MSWLRYLGGQSLRLLTPVTDADVPASLGSAAFFDGEDRPGNGCSSVDFDLSIDARLIAFVSAT
jgi:hypothetical protein